MTEPQRALTVGAVAALVGVTVRTLHHWDSIGLVSPSERSGSGYRLYTSADLARLHRVLVYRELGVPLTEIAALLEADADDALESLLRQRDHLRERIAELQRMSTALDRLIEARESGLLLSPEEQVAIFGGDWKPAWVGEARERWGDTPQWAQYAEQSAQRSPEQWRNIVASVEALHAELAEAFRAGVAPGSAAAAELAERHRDSLCAYFHCTHSMHVLLARGYTEDPGFAAYYDAMAPGLAAWLRAIVESNARAHGIDPETAVWE
ncbi:MerR family transcriptional regulator [Nocardia otitidiscaviarum]|uniref:MerR family transcriptional regulator n=1 Tax=Nocardia otitidiscaviarum TaxID=1823 RepID=A0A516NUR3_9NOCA|nr:MerR family transcriptional regulator [Nocardia otitidiscaviarum]MCP9622048.1 MerR family transcriptional regulator [Nocardia otitidiscaviarum]QDP82638.1 MerR family transcriptional regulator [Nocardia otitidiscaviarum]